MCYELASRVVAVVIGVGDASRSVAVSLLLVMMLVCECKAWGEVYLPLRVLFLQRLESKVLQSSVTVALMNSLMFLNVVSGQEDFSCSSESLSLSLVFLWCSSPVPELSFLPAPHRGWTRAGERRVQDNLHAHAQNEPIKNYCSQSRCSRQCVSQCLFQHAL